MTTTFKTIGRASLAVGILAAMIGAATGPFGALIAGFFASRKLFTARAKVVPAAPVADLTGDEQAELDRIVSGENPRSITKVSPR